MALRLLSFVIPSLVGALHVLPSESKAFDVPQFTINLDSPPRQRWKAYVQANKEVLAALWGHATLHLAFRMPEDKRNAWLTHHGLKNEHLEEIRGAVEALGTPGVSFEGALYFQLGYEVGTNKGCSGILATEPSGVVVHGRNMDLKTERIELPSGKVTNMIETTHDITFTRGGQAIYRSTAFAGLLGIHTGMRLVHPRLSFEQNTHYDNDEQENRKAAIAGGVDAFFFARDLLEGTANFQEAVKMVRETTFNSPQYLVLAGENMYEGITMEITRGEPDPSMSRTQELNPVIGRWYVVQTNEQPWNHKSLDSRRGFATTLVGQLGPKQMSTDTMLRVMRTQPIFNFGTIFTTIMVPATGFYQTILRYEVPEIKEVDLQLDTGLRKSPLNLQQLHELETKNYSIWTPDGTKYSK